MRVQLPAVSPQRGDGVISRTRGTQGDNIPTSSHNPTLTSEPRAEPAGACGRAPRLAAGLVLGTDWSTCSQTTEKIDVETSEMKVALEPNRRLI